MRRSATATVEAPSVSPAPRGTSTTMRFVAPDDRPRRRRRIWRVTANVLFLIMAVGWFFLLRPTWLGGPATIVRVAGVSMEPGMHTGDLVLVHDQDSYEVGDVVAFRVPQPESARRPHVIHRVVQDDAGVFTLRGDNNEHDDPWEVRESDIAGRLWIHVPGGGVWFAKLTDPVLLAALAAAVTAFLVIVAPEAPSTDRAEPTNSTARPRRRRPSSGADRSKDPQ